MNAVDTNILRYSLDRYDAVKQEKAQLLLRQLVTAPEPTLMLWQVLGEFVQQLRRWRDQGRLTPDEFFSHIQAFRYVFALRLPTPAALDFALDLAERYSLSHWDSMILGACLESGAGVLYTEDMGAPRTIASVRLINPFL